MGIYECSFGYGWHWLKETGYLLKRAPVIWLISGVLCGLIWGVPLWVTDHTAQLLLRYFVSLIMIPVLSGSLITMAYQCDQGSHIKVNQIFNALPYAGSFLMIQLINTGLMVLCIGFFLAILFALKIPFELIQFMQFGLWIKLILIIAVILGLLISGGLVWFAPALIVLRGCSAWTAMKTSLSGCFKSWQAWLVVMIGVGLLSIVIGALIVFLVSLLTVAGALTPPQVKVMTTIFSGLFLPVHAVLVYVACRDVFGEG